MVSQFERVVFGIDQHHPVVRSAIIGLKIVAASRADSSITEGWVWNPGISLKFLHDRADHEPDWRRWQPRMHINQKNVRLQ